MKTHTPTPQEMASRICRFGELEPVKAQYDDDKGIPAAAYATVAADQTFVLMAPAGHASATGEDPPVLGGDGGDVVTVNIATCPPGDGPMLHAHHYTHETFFCLNGRFRVRWGDKGEHEIFLDPWDMIAVPPGVSRDFCNVSDATASLLVFIQGPADRFQDVDIVPEAGAEIAARFGAAVRQRMEAAGLAFTAGLDVALPIDAAQAAE